MSPFRAFFTNFAADYAQQATQQLVNKVQNERNK